MTAQADFFVNNLHGGSAQAAAASPEYSEWSPAPALQPLPTCSSNPLVHAATRLLNLTASLRTLADADPAVLYRQLTDEIRFFETQALAANVARDHILGARYCLCTALDEAAAQTPWGGNGVWARYSLLVAIHKETWGGETYYRLLARLAQQPERHRPLIELLYYCNMLGFEGQFRIVENGHAKLEILKRNIATLLKTDDHASRLSSHWRGVTVKRELWRMVPPWVVAAACALLAFAVYGWLNVSLQADSNAVFGRLQALQVPSPVVAAPLPPPLPRLRRLLEEEVRAGLLEVRDLADRSVIILKGDGLFDSGSATVRANQVNVLNRVAYALNAVDGQIVVTGYTDSVPIRSVRFPSNWHLSQARAQAVAALIAAQMPNPARLRADGRGETNPVADNASATGRARNRRVEITLMLSSDEISRQLNPPQAASSTGGPTGAAP